MSSWAKASDRADAAETARDRAEFLAAGLRPLECRACGTCVLVKKNSTRHTSIQWITDAASSCPEFAARVARGESSALQDTCEKLRQSIEHAVREGLLEVPDA